MSQTDQVFRGNQTRVSKKKERNRKKKKEGETITVIVTEIHFISFLSPLEKHFELSISQLPENWEQPCDHHFES